LRGVHHRGRTGAGGEGGAAVRHRRALGGPGGEPHARGAPRAAARRHRDPRGAGPGGGAGRGVRVDRPAAALAGRGCGAGASRAARLKREGAMDAVESPSTRELSILREPRGFLVGRQTGDGDGVDRFLAEHQLTWQTDTTVGAEALAEMAGRVCYMSYGKGRKSNAEFLGHIVEVGHGSVLEHAVWSFLVTGVSRSFTHELVRH